MNIPHINLPSLIPSSVRSTESFLSSIPLPTHQPYASASAPLSTHSAICIQQELIGYTTDNNLESAKEFIDLYGKELIHLGTFPIDHIFSKHIPFDYTDKAKDILLLFLQAGCQVSESSARKAIDMNTPEIVNNYLESNPSKTIPFEWIKSATIKHLNEDLFHILYQRWIGTATNEERKILLRTAFKFNNKKVIHYLLKLNYPLDSSLYQFAYSLESILILWNKNIMIDEKGLRNIAICGEEKCDEIIEAAIKENITFNNEFFHHMFEHKKSANIINRIVSTGKIAIDNWGFYCAIQYVANGFGDRELLHTLFSKSAFIPDKSLWYGLLLHRQTEYLERFIQRHGYREELLEAALELLREDMNNYENYNRVRDYLTKNIPVSDATIRLILTHPYPIRLFTDCLQRYKGNNLQEDSECLFYPSNEKNDSLRRWDLLKKQGVKATSKLCSMAFSYNNIDLLKKMIEEDHIDPSTIDLIKLINNLRFDYKLSHSQIDFLRNNPVKITLSLLLLLKANDDDVLMPVITKRLRKKLRDKKTEKEIGVFCEDAITLLYKIYGSIKRNNPFLDSTDCVDFLESVYLSDPSTPLMNRIISHLPGSPTIWGLLYPTFSAPEAITSSSPLFFNEEHYRTILDHLNEYPKEGHATNKELCAYKLSIIFRDSASAISYIESFKKNNPNNAQPIHDSCLFDLPKSGIWDRNQWIAILEKNHYHIKWLNMLPFASEIENTYKKQFPTISSLKESKNEQKKSDKRELLEIAKKDPTFASEINGIPYAKIGRKLYSYFSQPESFIKNYIESLVTDLTPKTKRKLKKEMDNREPTEIEVRQRILVDENHFDELLELIYNKRNPFSLRHNEMISILIEKVFQNVPPSFYSFALSCIKKGVSKATFDKIINFCTKEPKIQHLLPHIDSTCEAIGYAGYCIQTLQPNDPYGGILGKLSSCCQSIDGPGNDSAEHGMRSPYGGFIILKKENAPDDAIIAQSWIGITERGELVFDSIEWNKGYDTEMIMAMYQMAAQQLVVADPRINGVYFGGGGNTPKGHKFPLDEDKANYSAIIGYGSKGYDSVDKRFILIPREKRETKQVNFTANDFVLVEGTDTIISPGKKTKGLSLNLYARDEFFGTHPNVKAMMVEHPRNPLLEEGRYNKKDERAHFGEYFIPARAIELIVKEKIKNRDNATHIIISDNNPQDLVRQLQEIILEEGQNILIGSIEGVHAIFSYVEKVDSKLRAVIVDPENPIADGSSLFNSIRTAFPAIEIGYTKDGMQTDFYSCSTFLIKSMVAFAKDGHSLTEEIFARNGQTPAKLLKMSQRRSHLDTLDQERRNTIVSKKRNLTLAQYLLEESVVFDQKSYNGAALCKKYKYLRQLSHSMV